MSDIMLGTITDDSLARRISSAMDLYVLKWGYAVRDGKAFLEVYAEVEDEDAKFLEAMLQ